MRFLATLAVYGAAVTETSNQPIIRQDLADTDLIRVNDTYDYSASNMQFSPGAPILRSHDLVNWEYFSHPVPSLDFGGNRLNFIGCHIFPVHQHPVSGLLQHQPELGVGRAATCTNAVVLTDTRVAGLVNVVRGPRSGPPVTVTSMVVCPVWIMVAG